MRRHVLILSLIAGLAAAFTFGCAGAGTFRFPPLGSGSGSLVVFGSDSPLADITSFSLTVTSMTLTPQDGGAPVSVFSSSESVTVDFAALLDFSTILKFTEVPAGTYSQVTLTLANPQITVLDVSQAPPAAVQVSSPTLTTATVTIDVSPALTVARDGSVGLALDFDLLKSVQTDALGQVTGTVDPVFRASPTTPSTESGLGTLEDLRGLVQSVTTGSIDPLFVGKFALQARDGQTFTIQARSTTEFDTVSGRSQGVSGLSGLLVGTFAEVDAFVDSNGKVVAEQVEVEEQEDASLQRAAFVGLITTVTRDANGNATQFRLIIREEFPDVSGSIPLGSSLAVAVAPSTRFAIAAEGVNLANLEFSPATLGLGQQVVAHGHFQPGAPGVAPILNASSVFLSVQSIVGNFSTLLASGADGKTGGFTLSPAASIFQGQPISVLTFGQTVFTGGLVDLNSLDPQPTLTVKGLLFFEQSPGSVNGVSWTPPARVLVASRVRRLP